MRNVERVRIFHEPPSLWERFPERFVWVFGLIWLFIEPLTALDIIPDKLPDLKAWWYLILVILVLVFTSLFVFKGFFREYLVGKMNFIPFDLALTEIGTRYQIEAPEDMRIGEFLNLFLKKVENSVSLDSDLSIARHRLYENTLMLRQERGLKELDSLLTIGEIGLTENDVCEIHGEIKPVYTHVLYCSSSRSIMLPILFLGFIAVLISLNIQKVSDIAWSTIIIGSSVIISVLVTTALQVIILTRRWPL